jgi:hypothetical protein
VAGRAAPIVQRERITRMPDGNGAPAAATRTPASTRAPEVSQAESLIQYLARRAEMEGESRAYDVAVSQLDRILAADDEAALWDADEYESTGGRDLVDVEQNVKGFTVHKGGEQFKTPLGFYIMVNSSRLSDGSEFIWNTGAPLIIGKLRWLEAHEKLPINCVIRSTPTPNGEVLKLRPIPTRATAGKAES